MSNVNLMESSIRIKTTFFLFAIISTFSCSFAEAKTGGDAVYREGGWANNLDHTGVYNTDGQVYEIRGYWYQGGDGVELSSWTRFLDGQTYLGAFWVPGMSSSKRDNILDICDELDNDPEITYTLFAALYYESSPGTWIDVDEITDIRCDGVVEYAYEWNYIWIWGKAYPPDSPDDLGHFDISVPQYCDEHENLGADQPWIELSPKVQRGGSGTDWTKLRPSGDDNYEENDIISTAYNISGNEQTWLTTIDGPGIQADDDWYEIYVSSGYENVIIDCQFLHADGDIDIKLYDSSGTFLTVSQSTSDDEYIDYTVAGSGTYYIKIYYGNAGNSYNLWWDDLSSGPSTPPPVPSLSSPSDGSTVSGTSVTFSWNASSGANNYHMQLAYDSGFSNLAFDDDVGNVTSVSLSPFPDNGTRFYWRVKAGNTFGWSNYSSAWNFYNGTISPPSLSSPSNGSTVNGTMIQFRWNESSGGDSYYLQVATDSSFNNTVYDDEVGYYIGIDIPGFPNDGTRYYWHVKAENSGRWSAYSSTWYFDNFPLVPPAPTLNLPSSGSNVSGTSVTFSWNASSGANNYHFQLATDAGFSNLSIDSDVGNTTSIPVSDFPDDGSRFYWRVKAGNVSGWSGYSSEWYFDNGTLSEYVISGYIRTAGGTAISGVTMTGWPGTEPVTDITGYYSSTVSSGWSGTITPSKSNYDFSPLSRTYSNVTSDQTEQTYTGSLVSTENFIEDFETGDFSSNPWYWFGDVSWFITSESVYEGNFAARSGVISHDRHTGIGVTKTLPSGNITFWRKVSSEDPNDLLIFYIDGAPVGVCTGEKDWTRKSYFIDEGTHTFDWVYLKNSSVSDGNDCGWIDDIIFEPEIVDPLLFCWTDLQTYAITEQNMTVTTGADFYYNWYYENNWFIVAQNGGFTSTFESSTSDDMELVVRHLSSAYAECQGGGYSPVTISLNGTPIVSNYDPAENHGGSHGFVTDIWPISVNAGTNTLEWATDSLCTNYWIRGLEIRHPTVLEGDLDLNSIVGLSDLLKLAKNWLKVCTTPNWCEGCDIDKTGFTDFGDFAVFALHWQEGTSP